MTGTDLQARITELVEPEANAHGFELVAVELAGGRGTPVVRVLLDAGEDTTLDAIGAASKWVSAILDEADPVTSPYVLEVSSPGIDRPLVKPADFDRFAGETATLKLVEDGKRRSVTGELIGFFDDAVVLDVDGERVSVPYGNVQKARLKGVVDFGKGRGSQ